jgi:hypothetical protein
MSDIIESFDIHWPFITYPPFETLADLASNFQNMIGMKVNYSHKYHGAKRTNNAYALEPDSSVESDNDDMTGLEFISPPLPLKQAILHLQKVREWAKRKGCETNESTGLHINCSIKKSSAEDLDYVKMALFLGDNYILEQFNRVGNEFAASAFDIIKEKVKKYPYAVKDAFDYMRRGLTLKASRIIHENETNKYTSINIKDDGAYLEIRSPGGDWLNDDLDKIIATMNRIAFAVDIAYDSNKYKREYTTKLYKMLASSQQDHLAELFAKFSSGELSADQLKINWARLEIAKPKNPTRKQQALKFLEKEKTWNVRYIDTGRTTRVIAATKEEAYKKGLTYFSSHSYYSIPPDTPITDFEITEVTAGQSPSDVNAGRWSRWYVSLANGRRVPISARNSEEAESIALAQFPQNSIISVRPENANMRNSRAN